MAVLQDQAVDGIILDLGLPDADGLDLLTWARTRIVGLPVLILTARDGIDDRVRGLNAGADDYLTKPFNMQELQARLQAMLRRARQPAFTQATSAQGGPSTTIGNLQLDHQGRVAALDGQPLELTQREWELLELLVNRCGEVVTRDDVLAAWRASPRAWPDRRPLNSNALEVYVHRLRKSSISPASTSATSAAWGTCSKSHEGCCCGPAAIARVVAFSWLAQPLLRPIPCARFPVFLSSASCCYGCCCPSWCCGCRVAFWRGALRCKTAKKALTRR